MDKVDFLQGSRTTNLYSISLNDMLSASPVCLLTKASSTKSWLWHRRLNHLNFGTLNELARNDLVRGLPLLKYDKDHLCPSYQLEKSKKASHPLKTENSNKEILNLLHMDLCRPMRTKSINKKRYVLVIVDDYTRFGWVRFLRTQDETPTVFEKFLKNSQLALKATVYTIRTDNGKELAPENANGSPSTTNILEGAPAVTLSSSASKSPSSNTDVLSSKTPLDTFDSDFDDTYIAPETTSAASSSSPVNLNVSLNNPIPHVQKWTKDHSLENVIGDSQRPVSTRRQLQTDAMWCFFNEFLSHIEPKNYKQVLEHSCWIKDMQEEIHEFERLDVWNSKHGFMVSKRLRLVSWSSKKQKSTAISTTEAEYIALSGGCAQILWMRLQLSDYGFVFKAIPMYYDNQSAIALCSGPIWLFNIDTLTKTINYQPVTTGNQSNSSAGVEEQFDAEKVGEEIDQQYVLFLVWSFGSTNPQNTNEDASFDEKELEFEGRKPKSKVNVSLCKFEDFSDNSINEDNVASTLVPTVGQFSPNSTNTFSAAELEDITHSDDEDDVGAEADFNNLETSITVSPIPTTRVYKDHHVTQIIGDLSLATQIMSLARVANDQGGLSQINSDDFYTCMFAFFLSQEEPRREEGIDYEEVFALETRIEAIRLFLAYSSFMGFMVYKMDVKSAFLYGTIKEEVYVCQPSGFEYRDHPDKVYKVVKALYELCQALRAWYETLANYLLENDGKSGSTPIDTKKPLLKDLDGVNTPRCDEDRLELMELTIFLLLSDEKVRVKVSAVDLQVSAVNDVTRLQALVDKKKVVVTEATIRDALHLNDAEGIECLPNEEIFAELARIGAKRTSWNEFSSSMTSAVIFLSTGDLSSHSTKYSSPALTQKVFANMRRVDVNAVGVVTEGDVSATYNVVPTVVEEPSIPSPTPPTSQPQPSQDIPSTSQVGTTQRIETSNDTVMEDVSKEGRMINDMDADVDGKKVESQAQVYQIDLEHANKVLSMQDDKESELAELQEVVEVVTTAKLITEKRNRVVIRDPDETITTSIIIHFEAKSKDKGKGILVEEPKPLEKQAQIEQDEAYARKKPQTEAQARKNMMIYLRNVVGFKMDSFKGMTYDIRLIFEKKFNSNVDFLLKTKEKMDEEDIRVLKRLSKSQDDNRAKKKKLDKENRHAFNNNDDEYPIQYMEYLENSSNAIAPDLPTEEPDNSLSIGDEHLSTILEMESDEVKKYSIENLVPIPSESEGILDNMCDVPFSDKNHFDAESDLIESLLTQDTLIVYSPKIDSLHKEFAGELAHIDPIPPGIDETDSDPKDDICFIEQLLCDDTLSEDNSFKDIDYVKTSPPDSELVSLEEAKDEILRAKLLNTHLLIDKIESLNNNPTPDCVLNSPSSYFLSYSDNSLLEFETFSDHTKETSSGIAMEAILGSPRVYVPNVLPIHHTLYQDLDFSSSDDSLGSDLDISFPSRTRNEIFDPVIFIEVQSERLLSREEFSISLICDPLYPVFKPDILSFLLISHRDKIISDFSKNPMMMYGGDIPHLDVLFLHFYPS
nr:ribonuclease H-like domain-containing protein [Tanacetum cinerariifolium]